MYTFRAAASYKNSYDKVVGNNETLRKKVKTALVKLSITPLHPSLHSHKISTSHHGLCWSSSVSGDIRILWNYDKDKRLRLLLLDIGGHSGTHKVYK